jgi:tetratricopeptide (TPR) repeat protein
MKNQIFKPVICLAALMCIAGAAQTYAQQQDGEEMRRYIRYAQTAYSRGEFSNALKEYQEALKLSPNYPELYKAIGDVYEKLATTADLNAAITHYKRYLDLAPDAADARQIRDKIYDLEYLSNEQGKQDRILDDLSGEWVAINNLKVTKIDETKNTSKKNPKNSLIEEKTDDETMQFTSDVIFQIVEIQKTGRYSVTMKPEGSRFYSANLIEKTVHIVPAKNNAFTFVFADATIYTPSAVGYDTERLLGSMFGTATGKDWVGSLTEISITARQESDLPSNTQTAYTFALRYEDGILVGLINVVGKYADPTRQQTTGNETYEITFVKRDDNFNELLRTVFDTQPDVIDSKTFKDKWGKKLSDKEIAGKLSALDPQLGKQYRRARVGGLTGLLLVEGKTKTQLIDQYNEQIIQQHKSKPTAELRFGITSSGELGWH